MPNNEGIAQAVANAGLVNSSVGGEIIREIDLGEVADILKGQMLKVCVNPASYVTPILYNAIKDISRAEMLRALSVLTGIPTATLEQWGDAFITEAYVRARTLFVTYDDELRKNSPAR